MGGCQLLFRHPFFFPPQVEFKLSKLLPLGNDAVNTRRFPLSHLPMVNIAVVTMGDTYSGQPCSASKKTIPSRGGAAPGDHRDTLVIFPNHAGILSPMKTFYVVRCKLQSGGLCLGLLWLTQASPGKCKMYCRPVAAVLSPQQERTRFFAVVVANCSVLRAGAWGLLPLNSAQFAFIALDAKPLCGSRQNVD